MAKLFKVKCDYHKCPAFKECVFLPYEVETDNGTVDVMFIGEGPGPVEVKMMRPFIGPSGTILRNIINRIGIRRYAIDNLVRYHPTENGNTVPPSKEAIHYCGKHLIRVINKLKPKKIVMVGGQILKFLDNSSNHITSERGRVRELTIGDIKVKCMPTFHPAFALRSGSFIDSKSSNLIGVIFDDINRFYNDINYTIPDPPKANVVSSIEDIDKLSDRIHSSKIVSFDVETDNLNIKFSNRLLSIAFCLDGKEIYVIPLCHPETPFSSKDLPTALIMVRGILERKSSSIKFWLAHNSKFDLTVIRNLTDSSRLRLNRPVLDTMVMAFLLNECRLSIPKLKYDLGPFSLKYIARNEFGFSGYTEEELVSREGMMSKMDLDSHIDYVAKDAFVCWHIFRGMLEISRFYNYESKMMNMLRTICYFQTMVFSEMETNGIYIDKDLLFELSSFNSSLVSFMKEIDSKLKKSRNVVKANSALIQKMTGSKESLFGPKWVFDINKPSHLHTLFFDVMKLEPVGDKPSVDKNFQEKYNDVEEVKLFSEYNKTRKLYTSYVKQIVNLMNPSNNEDSKDGRIRPNFGSVWTVTGRSNASNPNTQQLPRGDNEARIRIRNLFSSEPGNCLVNIDLMTAEPRVWAFLSQDKELINLFWRGKLARDNYRRNPTEENRIKAETEGDFHRLVASEVFGLDPRDVDKKKRQICKGISLGRMYGRTLNSIARQLAMDIKEVEKIDRRIFGKFRKGNEWFSLMENLALSRLYVDSLFGRRRRLFHFLTGNDKLCEDGKRRARNSPIQSLSSDLLIVIAYMIINSREYIDNGWKLINEVHDSLTLEIPIEDIPSCIVTIERIVSSKLNDFLKNEFNMNLNVPIEVEFEIGKSMGNMVKWDFTEDNLEKIITNLMKEEQHGKKDKRKVRKVKLSGG